MHSKNKLDIWFSPIVVVLEFQSISFILKSPRTSKCEHFRLLVFFNNSVSLLKFSTELFGLL